jgi:hypothetical protein
MRGALRRSPGVVVPLRRAASALVALALFASPLLESLHEAQRVHFACPEDGELVEAPLGAPHHHARASGAGPFLFAEHESSPPPSSEGGHDHCAIAAHAHLRGREKSHEAPVPPVLHAATAASVTGDPAPAVSLAIYRFAPKASPPLA